MAFGPSVLRPRSFDVAGRFGLRHRHRTTPGGASCRVRPLRAPYPAGSVDLGSCETLRTNCRAGMMRGLSHLAPLTGRETARSMRQVLRQSGPGPGAIDDDWAFTMTRLGTLGLMVLLAPLMLLGQGRIEPRLLVVRMASEELDAWQPGPASGLAAKVWEAQPRSLDRQLQQAWRPQVPSLPAASLPVIADFDHDGVNDLLVLDPLGLTVYGRSPAYHPFPVAGVLSHPSTRLLIADVDGNGRDEVVTQRSFYSEGDVLGAYRVIEIWKPVPTGLQPVWQRRFDGGSSYILEWADADNDGQNEILTGTDTITILKRTPLGEWNVAAELPNIGHPETPGDKFSGTVVDVVRVGDVDGDGKNEVVATGNSGVVTVYKHRVQRVSRREHYPVLWQSPRLVSEGLASASPGRMAGVYTQGLAVGDVDGDGGAAEILVATLEAGIRQGESKSTTGGRIHLFKYDGQRGFSRTWKSGWTSPASIPAMQVADLDGDGRKEFLYNGADVYWRDRESNGFAARPLCSDCGTSYRRVVVGHLPELREPTTAVRIVPVRWSLPQGELQRGRQVSVAITLRSVWAEARDVVVTVAAADSSLKVAPQTVRVSAIPPGGTATLPPVAIEAGDASPDEDGEAFGDLLLDITAAGGYRQSMRLTVLMTGSPKGTPSK